MILIGFADDGALVVVTHNTDLLEISANSALKTPEKTEVIIITENWAYFHVINHVVTVK